jgi:mannose-1-phosphate guanylyltransferase
MKTKVSLSLDAEIIDELESYIDGKNIRSLSHSAETFLRKSLNIEGIRQGVIIAGGKGTRLLPLTKELPKPLIPIQGKPIVEHVIDLFRMNGIYFILMIVSYKSDKIISYFGDGSDFGVKIKYLIEEEPMGTAGCLRLAEPHIKGPFVFSHCDELKDINIKNIARMHKYSGSVATIALTTVTDPSAYGVVELAGSKIVNFVEKPSVEEAPSRLINAGLTVFDKSIFEHLPETGFAMLEKDVYPKLAKLGLVSGYPFQGQWYDTGTFDRYEEALSNWKGYKYATGNGKKLEEETVVAKTNE